MPENIVGPFGPGINPTTERPTDPDAASATDTWFAPCINGDPATGTKLGHVWLNKVAALLRRAIRGRGVPDESTDDDMLLKAINSADREIVNIGEDGEELYAGLDEDGKHQLHKLKAGEGIEINPIEGGGLEILRTLGAFGGGIKGMQLITESDTYERPEGVNAAIVIVVGGGGGGGSGRNPGNGTGAGGGGAGTAIALVDLSETEEVACTIGAPGAAGVGDSGDGGDGGSTAFGTLAVAEGGKGGVGSSEESQGGLGGIGTTGLLKMRGSAGDPANATSAGSGGSSFLGGGGRGANTPVDVAGPGGAGGNYGGGGGGGNDLADGGAGAPGVIWVIELS